jgi:hypothetical protein
VTIFSALVVIFAMLDVCEIGGGAGIFFNKNSDNLVVISDRLNVKTVF